MIAGALISTQAINILWVGTQEHLLLTSQNLNGLKPEGPRGSVPVNHRRKPDATWPHPGVLKEAAIIRCLQHASHLLS